MQLEDHPTVKRLGARAQAAGVSRHSLDAAELRQLALECGADDAGLVEISRPGLDPQRDELLRYYPWTKTLVSFVVRVGREPVRGAAASGPNLEVHRGGAGR